MLKFQLINKLENIEMNIHNIVLSKYSKGDTLTDIHCHLNGGISLAAIKRWCQMIDQSGSIHLPGYMCYIGKLSDCQSPIFCFANCTFSNWWMSRGISPIAEYTNEKRNLLANVSGEVRQFGESLHDIRQLKLNELLTRNDSFYIQLGQTCIWCY